MSYCKKCEEIWQAGLWAVILSFVFGVCLGILLYV